MLLWSSLLVGSVLDSSAWREYQELRRRIEAVPPLDVSSMQQVQRYQDSDVIVSPPAKCGTTVLLHLFHQARVRGEPPTFDDQMDVVWWPAQAAALALHDPNAPQPHHPRLFKSHSGFDVLPPRCRLAYMARDPCDALLSLAKFTPSLVGLPESEHGSNTMTLLYMAGFYLVPMLRELREWWAHRHEARVLFAFYKDVAEPSAKRRLLARILAFLHIEDMDEAVQTTILEQTSHAAMSAPGERHRFDDHRVAEALARVGGWELDAARLTGKVRKTGGMAGQGRQALPWIVRAYIRLVWTWHVTLPLGYWRMDDMRDAFYRELAEREVQ